MSDNNAILAAYDAAIETGVLTQNPVSQVYFRAGLLACREYMARFIEGDSPTLAASIRANWWPALGPDPGAPRKLNFDELAEERDGGGWRLRLIGPSVEALPVALTFIYHADAGTLPPQVDKSVAEEWFQVRGSAVLPSEPADPLRAPQPADLAREG